MILSVGVPSMGCQNPFDDVGNIKIPTLLQPESGWRAVNNVGVAR